jgi:hypothetical protein
MTASLGIRVIRSSLVDWRSMKKECRHARHSCNLFQRITRLQPISVNYCNLFQGIRRLQISSQVSGMCLLGRGRTRLVQQRLHPISVNICNLFLETGRLQLGSRVSGMCLLGRGKARLVQRRLQL